MSYIKPIKENFLKCLVYDEVQEVGLNQKILIVEDDERIAKVVAYVHLN